MIWRRFVDPSDIAIIFNITDLDEFIGDMLKREYNLDTTTIRDHVMNDNTDKVVFGTDEDYMSFEAPCVIFIDTDNLGFTNIYPLLSRARTRLTVICYARDEYSSHLFQSSIQYGTVVSWVHENGDFVKK